MSNVIHTGPMTTFVEKQWVGKIRCKPFSGRPTPKLQTMVETEYFSGEPTPYLLRMFEKWKEKHPGNHQDIRNWYNVHGLLESAQVRDEIANTDIIWMLRSKESQPVKFGLIELAMSGNAIFPHGYDAACEIAFRKSIRSHERAEELMLNGLLSLAYEPLTEVAWHSFNAAELVRLCYGRMLYHLKQIAVKPETQHILSLFEDIAYRGGGAANQPLPSLSALLDACTSLEGNEQAPKTITKALAQCPEKIPNLKAALQYLLNNCELSFGTKIAAQRALSLVEGALAEKPME